METNNISKDGIRKELLDKRKHFPKEMSDISSEKICDYLIDYLRDQKPDLLLLYMAYGKEVSLTRLIKWSLENNMEIALPKVQGDDMDFYHINSLEELKPGAFGILEPVGVDAIDLYDYEGNQVVCIVPGVGFDRGMHRMGHGRGYYDRFQR